MVKKNASLDLRLKKLDETRHYFLEKIKHNDAMSEKYKEACRALNYSEHIFIFASAVSGCVSISASLVGVPMQSWN